MNRAWAGLALALSGCLDFDAALAQCGDAGRCLEAPTGRHVVVRFFTAYHSAGAVDARAEAPDAVLVLDPIDGGTAAPFTRDAGRADFFGAPGRFSIRASPGGTLAHFDTTLERLDLGLHVAGRAGLPRADAGTAWRFDATGLVPGGLGFHVAVAGTGVAQPVAFARDAGAVSLDWSGLPLAADEALVLQRGSRVFTDDAGVAYDQFGVARAAAGIPFAATLAFLPPPVVTLPVDWRRDEFRALLPHPDATLSGSTLTVSAAVFSGDAGVAFADAPLDAQPFGPEVVELRPRAATGDLSGVLDVPQPFPGAWPLVVTAQQRFRVAHALPDGGEVVDFGFARRVERVGTAIGPVRPQLAVPTDVTIAGAPFAAAATLPNDHPLVTWTAPTGAGLRFTLTVARVAPDGSRSVAATLYTPRSALRIPAGVLERGHPYVVRLTTRSSGPADPEREPLVFALPVSENDVVSGLLTLP